jgi:hypothetical protein
MTAFTWEHVFGIGGVLGYLLFECVVFVVPFSLCLLGRKGVSRAVSRLPKTVISVVIVCIVGLVFSFVLGWATAGQAKAGGSWA